MAHGALRAAGKVRLQRLPAQFTGEKFDADDWAELFQQSGAKFAGPCAEHHDGFAMWDSALTEWDCADKGPKVDVTGKLADAIKKRGMKFIATFHHARNWQYYPHEGDFDTNDPKYAYLGSIYGPIHEPGAPPSEEYLKDWKARVVEVIDKYDPAMIWFDGGWGRAHYDPYKRELLAYYYNRAEAAGKQVAVTKKGEDLPEGVGILNFERGRAAEILDTLGDRHVGLSELLGLYQRHQVLHGRLSCRRTDRHCE